MSKYEVFVVQHPKVAMGCKRVIRPKGRPNFDFITVRGTNQEYYAGLILEILNGMDGDNEES